MMTWHGSSLTPVEPANEATNRVSESDCFFGSIAWNTFEETRCLIENDVRYHRSRAYSPALVNRNQSRRVQSETLPEMVQSALNSPPDLVAREPGTREDGDDLRPVCLCSVSLAAAVEEDAVTPAPAVGGDYIEGDWERRLIGGDDDLTGLDLSRYPTSLDLWPY